MDSPAHDVPVVMNSWLRFPVPKVGSLIEGHGICPFCNAHRMVAYWDVGKGREQDAEALKRLPIRLNMFFP